MQPWYQNWFPYSRVLRGGTSFGRCVAGSLARQTIHTVVIGQQTNIYRQLFTLNNIKIYFSQQSKLQIIMPLSFENI